MTPSNRFLVKICFLLFILPFVTLKFDPTTHPSWNLLPPKDKCGVSVSQRRIIGGSIPPLGAFPWIVRLGYIDLNHPGSDIRFKCGGSLISKYYVLTAAHCGRIPGNKLELVRFGEYSTRSNPDCIDNGDGVVVCAPPVQDIKVVHCVLHEHFEAEKNLKNDVSLVRLERPPKLSAFTQPICLPFGAALQRDFVNEMTSVAGWGLTEDGDAASELLAVDQSVMPENICNSLYSEGGVKLEMSKIICVGGRIGKDSCNGDSGGPLSWMGSFDANVSARNYLIGIVSFGPDDCGAFAIPGIYTRTTYFLEWILDHMEP